MNRTDSKNRNINTIRPQQFSFNSHSNNPLHNIHSQLKPIVKHPRKMINYSSSKMNNKQQQVENQKYLNQLNSSLSRFSQTITNSHAKQNTSNGASFGLKLQNFMKRLKNNVKEETYFQDECQIRIAKEMKDLYVDQQEFSRTKHGSIDEKKVYVKKGFKMSNKSSMVGNHYSRNVSNHYLINNNSKFIKMEGSNSMFRRVQHKKMDVSEQKIHQSRQMSHEQDEQLQNEYDFKSYIDKFTQQQPIQNQSYRINKIRLY